MLNRYLELVSGMKQTRPGCFWIVSQARNDEQKETSPCPHFFPSERDTLIDFHRNVQRGNYIRKFPL